MFGCINVFKPAGLTSHDVVARIRRWYGIRKVGHLGTLDPAAEGVLPICIGTATRLMEYFEDNKTYESTIELGILTTTLDKEGDELEREDAAHITQAQVEAALSQFQGTIRMRVPHHAAVHYKGKKLYHYAHKGERLPEEELPLKETTIYSIKLLKFEAGANPVLKLEVSCSTGTYIRSLARDLGRALGLCGGTLTYLLRTQHGRFTLETAYAMEHLEKQAQAGSPLLDTPTRYLPLPILAIQQPTRYSLLLHGNPVAYQTGDPALPGNSKALALYQGKLLGVVQKQGEQWKPVKILDAQLPVSKAQPVG